ncbi:MAG: hypothetical protein KDK08_29865 [Rhizobiaceae bacterium]|nr:hypothetical protein [Rhizobiaceae bacterium]
MPPVDVNDTNVTRANVYISRLLTSDAVDDGRRIALLSLNATTARLDHAINAAVIAHSNKGDILFECASEQSYAVDIDGRRLIPLDMCPKDRRMLIVNCWRPMLHFDDVTLGENADGSTRRVFLPTSLDQHYSIAGVDPVDDHACLRALALHIM